MHHLHVLPIALAGAALAACGEEERPVERARPPAAAPGSGILEVRMHLPQGPVFTEGSVPRIRIERRNGKVVVAEDVKVETLDRPLLRRRLAPGEYRFSSVQLPCIGNCGFLDPPAEETRCAVDFEVRDDLDQVIDIVLDAGPERRGRARCSVAPA